MAVEGPLVERAAELEQTRIAALEVAASADLESKAADAVARKAESAARAARVAQQAAETKVARELVAKDAGEEAAAKAVEELESAKAREEAARVKEANCEEAFDSAKTAVESKHAEMANAMLHAKSTEAAAAAAEAREEHRRELEATAAALEAEASATEAACRSGASAPLTTTVAEECIVSGNGLTQACVGRRASFSIEARDATGTSQENGGDSFFVSIRYNGLGARVRAQITDNNDGSYTVNFKPGFPGRCNITISLLGSSLPGTPCTCNVHSPLPCAAQCTVEGDSLSNCIAGKPEVIAANQRVHPVDSPSTARPLALVCSCYQPHAPFPCFQVFYIRFHDELGQLAPACDLDVRVQPVSTEQLAASTKHDMGVAGSTVSSIAGGAQDLLQSGEVESIVVGSKALDVTRLVASNSEWLGRVQPGRTLRVVKVQVVGEVVRACVTLDDDKSGKLTWRSTYTHAQSWRTPSWRAAAEAMEKAADEAQAMRAAAEKAAAERVAAEKAAAERARKEKVERELAKAAEEAAAVEAAARAAAAEAAEAAEAAAAAARAAVEAEKAEAVAVADKGSPGAKGRKTSREKLPEKKQPSASPAKPALAKATPPKPTTSSSPEKRKAKKAKPTPEELAARRAEAEAAAEAARKADAVTRLQTRYRGFAARRSFAECQRERWASHAGRDRGGAKGSLRGRGKAMNSVVAHAWTQPNPWNLYQAPAEGASRVRVSELKRAGRGWITVSTKDATFITKRVARPPASVAFPMSRTCLAQQSCLASCIAAQSARQVRSMLSCAGKATASAAVAGTARFGTWPGAFAVPRRSCECAHPRAA